MTLQWRPPGNIDAELLYEDEKNSITLRLTNPLTPETESTTHVWFAWSRNFGSPSDNIGAFVSIADKIDSICVCSCLCWAWITKACT